MLTGQIGLELAKKQKPLEIQLPPLHPAQREVAMSPARFKVLAKGRRFGGTRLGVTLCTATGLEGGVAFWVAPAYPIALIGWRLLVGLAQQIPGIRKKEAERRIIYPSGGVVQIKSADSPESLRGEGLDLVVIDEAAYVKEEAWTMSLRPALTDKKGKALFVSSPRGRNWFWRLWKDASEGKEGWQAWRFPTSTNPYIDPEEIATAKAQLPALVFAQEMLAEFTEHFGAMFKRDYFSAVIPEAPGGHYIRFWDLAASPEGDYSVGTKVGLIDGKYIVADVVRGRWDWPNLRRIITDTALEDGPEIRVGVEQAALELHAVQDLQSLPELASIVIKGIPVRPASASVRALYENLPRDKRAKAARAASWLARAEAGNVVLVEAPWNNGWLDRVCDFPLSGSPDDEIDSMSGAVQMIGRPRKISFGWC